MESRISSWLRCYRCWSRNLEVQVHYDAIRPIDPAVARSLLDGGGELPLRIVLAAVVDDAVVDDSTATLRLCKSVPALQRD